MMETNKEKLKDAIETSSHIDEVVKKLGGNPENHHDRRNTLRRAKKLDYDISHIKSRRASNNSYTDIQLIEAIKSSTSIAQVLVKLNLKPAGANYKTINNYVKKHNIDVLHFTGMLWSKGASLGPKRPIEDYLSNKFPIPSDRLKKKLIRENILVHKCINCNNSEWLGKPIPIELDHIDGNHSNNNLSNLRILCANCHALTDTYCGKNKGKKRY